MRFYWSYSKISLLSALLFLLLEARAEPLPIYQISDAQGTYLQIPLSYTLYRYSQHSDLRDLVALDADNNNLPYSIVQLAPAAVAAKKIDLQKISTDLAFYPIADDITPESIRALSTNKVSVSVNHVQVVVNDDSGVFAEKPQRQAPDFYLLDLRELKTPVTGLEIDWDPDAQNQYLEVELEGSSNLQNWVSLGRSTLVHIVQQEQVLKRNQLTLDLGAATYDFFRMKILRGTDNLKITHVAALQTITDIKLPDVQFESWNLAGKLSTTQTTVYLPDERSKSYPVSAWEYVRDEATPAEMLSINLLTNTYGDTLKVFSRLAEKQPWQLVYQGIWFNIQVGNEWQKSDPISLDRSSHKFWRIELNESVKNLLNPELAFSWQPTQLRIISNNKPPYFLAIDSESSLYKSKQVFNQLLQKAEPHWSKAGLVSLNASPIAAKQNPAHRVDWKKFLF